MGFRMGALKLVFVVPNAITFVAGCALVVFSAMTIHYADKYEDEEHKQNHAYAYVRDGAALALTAGILTSVVSMVALCGALANNRPLLIAYSTIMALVLVFEMVAAVLGFIFQNEIKNNFRNYLKDDLDKWTNGNDGEKDAKNFLIQLQTELSCCGAESPTEWLNAKNWNRTYLDHNITRFQLPRSCCTKSAEHCFLPDAKHQDRKSGKEMISNSTEGCYDKLLDNSHILAEVSIVVFFIQFFVLLLAIFFSRKVKEDQSVLIF